MSTLNAGKAAMAALFISSFKYLAYGTDGAAVAATDTTMTGESQRAAATATRTTTSVTNDTASLSYTFNITTTETIRKVGIADASSGGNFSHQYVLLAARSAVAGDTYALTATVAFS